MPDQLQVDADEVVAFLRKASSDIAKEVGAAVRAAAKIGAEKAREKAAEQGFEAPGRSGRGTGQLIRRIGSAGKGTTAFIRETASRGGYEYPRVYEFGHGEERAFLRPAAAEVAPEVEAMVREAVEAAIASLGQ